MILLRSQVIRAHIGLDEPKLLVVVSNNHRNRNLPSVLAVRITTSLKQPLRSIVEIPPGEVVGGRVMCDDLMEVFEDEVIRVLGALSPQTMADVNTGLTVALGLD